MSFRQTYSVRSWRKICTFLLWHVDKQTLSCIASTAHWLSLSSFTHKPLPISHWKCHCRSWKVFGKSLMAFNLLDRKRKLSPIKKRRLNAGLITSISIMKALTDNGRSVTESEAYRSGSHLIHKRWSGCRWCQVKQDDGLSTIHVCNTNGSSA